MKLKITKELIEQLEIMRAGLANNFQVESSGNLVFIDNRMYCFDGNTFISNSFPDFPESSISGIKFIDLIKQFENQEFQITKKEDVVSLKAKKKNIKFNSLQPKQAPVTLPTKWLSIPENLLKALEQSVFSIRKDEIKPSLACALVDKQGFVYSCDNYRATKINFNKRLRNEFLIQGGKIKDLIKFNPTHFQIDQSWILFKNRQDGVFGHRIIEDEFPVLIKEFFENYQKVFNFTLPKDELSAILKHMTIFHDELKENKVITIVIENDELCCKNTSSFGAIDETIPVNWGKTERVEFEINPAFLLEIMDICQDVIFLGNGVDEGDEDFQIEKALFQAPDFEHIVSLV